MFGKEVDKSRLEKKNRSVTATGTDGSKTPGSSKKRKRIAEDEIAEKLLELDELNRPKVKAALVSGPPGLGKNKQSFSKLNIYSRKSCLQVKQLWRK